jgi:hypothetical protein
LNKRNNIKKRKKAGSKNPNRVLLFLEGNRMSNGIVENLQR